MATSPQIDLISKLLKDRDVSESLTVEAQAVTVNGEWRDGSAMIERLKGCAFKTVGAKAAQEQDKLTVTEPGVYRKDGKVYIVKPTRETAKLPVGEQKLYAKELVETGDIERLTESGDVIVGIEFIYARGAIYTLSPSDKMPLVDAKALTARYGRCIVCGRHLKDAKSVAKGIGPVCESYFGTPAAPVEDPEGGDVTERVDREEIEEAHRAYDEDALEAKIREGVEWMASAGNEVNGLWARFGAFCGTIDDSITRENKEAILAWIEREQASMHEPLVALALM
jgi:hypothetical protein